ncbi:MAG: ATP-binding cassette domain-containing protein [Phycisphaerae bacterium]|nr:ATP-binding cassette domain-containing protein [Phycisphaerae bacterium]
MAEFPGRDKCKSRVSLSSGDGPASVRCESAEQAEVRVEVHVIREPAVTPMTERKREICWNYGIPTREAPFAVADRLTLTLRPGSILLLTGPSGSGKSSLLRAIAEKAGPVVWVNGSRPRSGRSIVDHVAPRRPLATALEILTACGLGEPRLWGRAFSDLSDGERFRASLAGAIGKALSATPPAVVCCDEFTAILHRRLAGAVAYNLRKLITRHRLILIVAGTHDDILRDLQADQVVRLAAADRPAVVVRRPVRSRAVWLRRRVVIEPGGVRDYQAFAPMHYRHRDGLGFVDKVFLLREQSTRDPLGILVFAHAPMELSLRNASTGGRFARNLPRINRELRILRRLVMHPDVRGCGLGHWFVRKTLPRVGVRFIECLAAMGMVNPVFERAGMMRVGECPLPKGRLSLLERLRMWKLDPFSPDFERRVARTPRVQRLIRETVRSWAGAMHGPMRDKIAGWGAAQLTQSFRHLIGRPPVYYLWDREGEYPLQHPDNSRAAAPSARSRKRLDDTDCRTTREKDRHRPERD